MKHIVYKELGVAVWTEVEIQEIIQNLLTVKNFLRITLQDLGESIGCSSATLKDWFGGKCLPSGKYVFNIVRALQECEKRYKELRNKNLWDDIAASKAHEESQRAETG